jgi:hypothetical protein
MMMMTGLALFLSAASLPGEPLNPATPATPAPSVHLSLGYKVANRQIAAEPSDHVYRASESVIAWTQISGLATGFVEHVWYRDDKEVARHYLPVSSGRSWRTWSRHTVRAGDYKVVVLGPDGSKLAQADFQVGDSD